MSPEILNLEWELSIRKLLNPWSFVCVNDFLPNPDLFSPEVLDLRSDGTKVAASLVVPLMTIAVCLILLQTQKINFMMVKAIFLRKGKFSFDAKSVDVLHTLSEMARMTRSKTSAVLDKT